MYAVVMFLKTVWDSHGGFYFRSRFLCVKQPIKKIQINSKTLCPQSPSFLVPRPQSAKRSEKGYGDENERNPASFPGEFAIALGSKPPQLTYIARIGLGTRLRKPRHNYTDSSSVFQDS